MVTMHDCTPVNKRTEAYAVLTTTRLGPERSESKGYMQYHIPT
jgi:hypothetical protein